MIETKSKYLQRVLNGEDAKTVILEMEELINKMDIALNRALESIERKEKVVIKDMKCNK